MRILLMVVLFFCSACQQQTPPDAMALTDEAIQQITSEVRAASDQVIEVSKTFDGEGLIPLLSDHPDFTFSSNGVRFATKQTVVDDVIPGWSTSGKSQEISVDVSTITVLSEDVALESFSGLFSQTLNDDSVSPEMPVASTFVWHKTEAGWQLLHVHQSWIAPASGDS